MEAGKRTINDIFNGNRILEIPFFQRAYVWEETQWERLLQDMELVSENNKPYFLGSVILKQQITDSQKSVGDLRTVVDGQQRLTTLNIFLKALCLKTNKNALFDRTFRLINDNEISLKHNHNDIDAFNKVVSLEKVVELKGEDNISKAFNYFIQYINTDKIDFQRVITNINFVGIDLGIGENEQQIFDTINSLGVRLTTAELLKNFLFGRDDLKSYNKNWKDVFEKDVEVKTFWDKEITAGRIKRDNIDLFFHSFLQIKLQDENINVNTEDKKNFSKVEGLFDSYKQFIHNYNISKADLIAEIKEFALIYKNNIDHDVIENELSNEYGVDRINAIVFGLENTTLIPYILYILKNVAEKEEQNAIFEYLESYIMRRMICHSTNKNYNKLFSEHLIANKALTRQQLKELIENKSDKVNFMPSDKDMKEGFHNSKLINKQTAGILYLIESKIRNRDVHSTALLGLNKYSLEHIMPKKWENNWNSIHSENDRINRDRKLLTLGNLTIITSSLNSSIRDADWNTKRKGKKDKKGLKYYSSGIDTFGEFLEYTTWNEIAIEERANFLYKKALDVWKI